MTICDHEAGGVLDWELGRDEHDRFVLRIAYRCQSCGIPFVFDGRRTVLVEGKVEHVCPLISESADHGTVILAIRPLETVH